MKLTVREYLTAQGKNPFRDWLKRLDVGVQARIQGRVLRFEGGNIGDHKAVGGGIWEARLDFGPGLPAILRKRRGCSDRASSGRRQIVADQRYRRGETVLG
jgi:putative component of toxin-antitoxin plasmid stabilization module